MLGITNTVSNNFIRIQFLGGYSKNPIPSQWDKYKKGRNLSIWESSPKKRLELESGQSGKGVLFCGGREHGLSLASEINSRRAISVKMGFTGPTFVVAPMERNLQFHERRFDIELSTAYIPEASLRYRIDDKDETPSSKREREREREYAILSRKKEEDSRQNEKRGRTLSNRITRERERETDRQTDRDRKWNSSKSKKRRDTEGEEG